MSMHIFQCIITCCSYKHMKFGYITPIAIHPFTSYCEYYIVFHIIICINIKLSTLMYSRDKVDFNVSDKTAWTTCLPQACQIASLIFSCNGCKTILPIHLQSIIVHPYNLPYPKWDAIKWQTTAQLPPC